MYFSECSYHNYANNTKEQKKSSMYLQFGLFVQIMNVSLIERQDTKLLYH